MKNLFRTLLALLVVAIATGAVCYRLGSDPRLHAAAARGDAMEWLRADFQLTDAQFAAIRQLHDSYAGTCEEHCRMIMDAAEVRDQLQAAGRDAAKVAAAEAELQRLTLVCETAIARHVREVAALMNPEAGQRYLALVLPKIADFDHRAAPDLRLDHRHP